jgi:hypothetical protein
MDKGNCQQGLDNSAKTDENLPFTEEKIELRRVK